MLYVSNITRFIGSRLPRLQDLRLLDRSCFGRSERDTDAAFGSPDAALVGHRDAFQRAEHCDVGTDAIIEARTRHHADGAALPRGRESEVLADQDGTDGDIA